MTVPAIVAGDEHELCLPPADRGRRAERGICRGGPADGTAAILAARVAGRHSQLCRRSTVARLGGYRAIVPDVRGCGTTRFLSAETPRNAQQAAVAADVIDLMDALRIEKAIFAGYDWGGRTADIVAASGRSAGGPGLRERLASDRQSGGEQEAVAAGRADTAAADEIDFATDRGALGGMRNTRASSRN